MFLFQPKQRHVAVAYRLCNYCYTSSFASNVDQSNTDESVKYSDLTTVNVGAAQRARASIRQAATSYFRTNMIKQNVQNLHRPNSFDSGGSKTLIQRGQGPLSVQNIIARLEALERKTNQSIRRDAVVSTDIRDICRAVNTFAMRSHWELSGDAAAQVAERILRLIQKSKSLPPEICHTVIKSMFSLRASNEVFDQTVQCLKSVHGLRTEQNPLILTTLIHSYGAFGRLDHALELFEKEAIPYMIAKNSEEMLNNSGVHDQVASAPWQKFEAHSGISRRKLDLGMLWNVAMQACVQCGAKEKAWDIFREMEEVGRPAPKADTYNLLIFENGIKGYFDESLKWFAFMRERNISPDLKTVTIVMQSLVRECEQGAPKERLRAFVDEIYKMLPSIYIDRPFWLLLLTSAGILDRGVEMKNNNESEVFRVVAHMMDRNYDMGRMIVTHAISVLSRIGKHAEAVDLFRERAGEGDKIMPDNGMLNAVSAAALSAPRVFVDDVISMIHSYIGYPTVPTDESYINILQYLAHREEVIRAVVLMEEISNQYNVTLTYRSLNLVLPKLARMEQYNIINQLILLPTITTTGMSTYAWSAVLRAQSSDMGGTNSFVEMLRSCVRELSPERFVLSGLLKQSFRLSMNTKNHSEAMTKLRACRDAVDVHSAALRGNIIGKDIIFALSSAKLSGEIGWSPAQRDEWRKFVDEWQAKVKKQLEWSSEDNFAASVPPHVQSETVS